MFMHTQSGRVINPLSVRPEDVDINDIAHSLAMTCRYNGHTSRFYSVAEHCCLLASYMMPRSSMEVHLRGVDLARAALMHDASEAYVGDMIAPIKHQWFRFDQEIEAPVVVTISEVFGVPLADFAAIKEFDRRISYNEMEALHPQINTSEVFPGMEPLPLDDHTFGMDPASAELWFLETAHELGLARRTPTGAYANA